MSHHHSRSQSPPRLVTGVITLLSLEEGSVFTHSHTITSSLVAFNTINVMTHQSPALPSPLSPRLIIQPLTNMSTGMSNGQSTLPGSKVELHFLLLSPQLPPPKPTYPHPPISINGSITMHPAAGFRNQGVILDSSFFPITQP